MRRLKCILLTIVIALSVVTVISADEGFSSEDIDISDLIFNETVEDVSLETPAFSDMQLVAENESMKVYFYPDGLDVYVVSDTGKVWSNVLMDEYYHQEEPSASVSSQLLTVNACDKDGNVKEYILYDGSNTDISADYSVENDVLSLDVKITEINLSFKVLLGIDNDAFYYHIPDKEIKENGGKIISVIMMQNFGASRNDEDGYIFYPDGSGAVMDFNESNGTASAINQFPIYGNSDTTYVQLERNWDDNIYGALLPVFGVSQTDNGLLIVVDKGAADAKINIVMPGYQVEDVYRAYISYNYRSFSSTEFNQTTISSLVEERTKVDRKCCFYLLSGEDNNYSGMANRYRKYLIDNGTLKEKKADKSLPISLNLLCGVQKNGLLSTTLQKMTTFEQSAKIAEWLNTKVTSNSDILLSGWAQGGWDVLPTQIKAEGKLGGKSGLKRVQEYCDKTGMSLSLDVDALLANSDTGKFNARKEAVRNYFGDFFVDKTGVKYILNSTTVLNNAYTAFSKEFKGSGINLLTVGKIAFPDYNSKNVCTTEEIINSYVSVMQRAVKEGRRVSATTGNAYILPYADMIYSLPQRDSGYTFTSYSVPFYQMVVHGYVDYTGTVGNIHYDYDRCVLEWIETGSIPSYIITHEKTNKLLETEYDSIFSSEFSVWSKKIEETYKKLNEDFGALHNQTMVSHKKITNGVVKVTYSDGTEVYINYNDASYEDGSISVAGKDYLIVGE